MTQSPYRCADDRFPWVKTDFLDGWPLYFLMSGPRSESWYSCGVDHHKEYLNLISPGDTVIDCGANEGYIAVAAAIKAGPLGKVYALEVARHNIEPLKINLKLNRLEGRMHVQHCAVGDTSGVAQVSGEIMGNGEPVAMVTIDELNLTPDVIKIDVEGYELKVLRGARQTLQEHKPTIFLEAHLSGEGGVNMSRFGDSPADILQFLQEVGYTAWLQSGEGLSDPGKMPNGVVICTAT